MNVKKTINEDNLHSIFATKSYWNTPKIFCNKRRFPKIFLLDRFSITKFYPQTRIDANLRIFKKIDSELKHK